jgi:hypothetical protein
MDVSVAISIMELYGESIRDLLDDQPKKRLDIKQGKNVCFL